jgi:DNA-binding MarR family transcriptional regulator
MNTTSVDNVNYSPGGAPEEVFERVHTIMHLFRAGQYRVLRGEAAELTHMEGKLLGFFARQPGATLRDLAAHSGRDKGQLARLIKTLRHHGLLAAQDTQGDRRSVRLQLTPAGRTVHLTLQRQVGRLAKVAVKGLQLEECRQLATLLERVQTNLEAANAPSQ